MKPNKPHIKPYFGEWACTLTIPGKGYWHFKGDTPLAAYNKLRMYGNLGELLSMKRDNK